MAERDLIRAFERVLGVRGGRVALAAGDDAAVVRAGGVAAVLTTRRKPFHFVRDLLALGLDPEAHDVTVVKIGYLVPDLFGAARGWMIALTPGGVDQHLTRLGHRHLERPIYPLDPEMSDPPLVPTVLARM
jgi:microcystin degradation protein MlrC